MPITPTYPGVYIEEVPSGVRTITGVATSIAAFIDFFKRGPMNKAVQCLSMADFDREFGGLHDKSEASYAIQQFFLNGGSEAWVVRTASGTYAKATAVLMNAVTAGASALTMEAVDEGTWGNSLRVRIDYQTETPATVFNLVVSEYVSVGGVQRVSRSETFRNLTMDSSQTQLCSERCEGGIQAGSGRERRRRPAGPERNGVRRPEQLSCSCKFSSDNTLCECDHRNRGALYCRSGQKAWQSVGGAFPARIGHPGRKAGRASLCRDHGPGLPEPALGAFGSGRAPCDRGFCRSDLTSCAVG